MQYNDIDNNEINKVKQGLTELGNALEVIAVTNVGFDSPTTNPRLNLIPPLNLFHYSILTN